MKKMYLIIGVLFTLTGCGTSVDVKPYKQLYIEPKKVYCCV